MLVDSHCHLNFPELAANLGEYLAEMVMNEVGYALVVATRPDNIQSVIDLANQQANLFAAVGVHPDEKIPDFELTPEFLYTYAQNPKVIAIGETGLDYYWNKDQDLSWQHKRFQIHIEVAKQANLPLVIHTRDSAADTWQILADAKICSGAVLHCFTADISWARKFLDLGCYISLSGIDRKSVV